MIELCLKVNKIIVHVEKCTNLLILPAQGLQTCVGMSEYRNVIPEEKKKPNQKKKKKN